MCDVTSVTAKSQVTTHITGAELRRVSSPQTDFAKPACNAPDVTAQQTGHRSVTRDAVLLPLPVKNG